METLIIAKRKPVLDHDTEGLVVSNSHMKCLSDSAEKNTDYGYNPEDGMLV